jgi:hypothetical protein
MRLHHALWRPAPLLIIAILLVAGLQSPAQAAPTCFGQAASPGLLGTKNADTLIGTAGNDVIIGKAGKDVLVGNGGDDLICGAAGVDLLFGADGADQFNGGAGNDQIYGGNGKDTLQGADGDDWLFGELGNDKLVGGPSTQGDVCMQQGGTGIVRTCESSAPPGLDDPPPFPVDGPPPPPVIDCDPICPPDARTSEKADLNVAAPGIQELSPNYDWGSMACDDATNTFTVYGPTIVGTPGSRAGTWWTVQVWVWTSQGWLEYTAPPEWLWTPDYTYASVYPGFAASPLQQYVRPSTGLEQSGWTFTVAPGWWYAAVSWLNHDVDPAEIWSTGVVPDEAGLHEPHCYVG